MLQMLQSTPLARAGIHLLIHICVVLGTRDTAVNKKCMVPALQVWKDWGTSNPQVSK